MPDLFVLDASVAAKWFLLDEPDWPTATALLEEFRAGGVALHVPAVFAHEVCNTLVKACSTRRRESAARRLEPETAQEALALLLHIHTADPASYSHAVALATRFHKLYYDMTYLALAEELGCRWITADDKILLSTAAAFPVHRVLLLSALARS